MIDISTTLCCIALAFMLGIVVGVNLALVVAELIDKKNNR